MEEINKIENILKRKLNSKEKEYVNIWVNHYNYNFEIISIALYYTTNRKNPNFEYLNCLIKDWYEKGFKTIENFLQWADLMKFKRQIENDLNKTLNKTEIKYVQKWVNKFNYDYIIIKLAMEYVNSNEFKDLDDVATEWYKEGLQTKEDIIAWIESIYRIYDERTEKILGEDEIKEKMTELKNKTIEYFYLVNDTTCSFLERTHSNINPFLKQLFNITNTSLKWVSWFSKYDKFLK